MTRSRTKDDLTTGTRSLRRSRTIASRVQQDEAHFPQPPKFPEIPHKWGELHTSPGNVHRFLEGRRRGSSSSIYGDREHPLCPGREGTFKNRWSTVVYGIGSLKRRDRFENRGVHPELSGRQTTESDARHLPCADAR